MLTLSAMCALKTLSASRAFSVWISTSYPDTLSVCIIALQDLLILPLVYVRIFELPGHTVGRLRFEFRGNGTRYYTRKSD